MRDNSFKKNIVANAFQQIITYILPFVTVPYLTRVIGAEGIGIYSYTNSIIQYFILFGTIGLSLYGTRQIAYVRDNHEKLEETFWEIFSLRIIFSSLSLATYTIFILITDSQYKLYMAIQSLALIGNAIDISWYYQGIEEFTKLVRRTIVFKLLGTACIFLFVNCKSDVWIYVAIQTGTIFIGNLILWLNIRITNNLNKVSFSQIISHFKPALLLFIPQVAIEIYAVFDKTMLGVLANVTQVGLYTKAEEFAKVPLMIISVLSTVLFPKLSNQFKKNGISILNESLNQNLQIVGFIGIGASFGIAGIANEFVKWMMGEEFLGAIPLLYILSPLTFFIGTSNMIGRQYLLPANKNKTFTITVISGAIINFVLNLVFIPKYGGVGACIATVLAEGSVAYLQYLFVRIVVNKRVYYTELLKCFVSGTIMFFIIRLLGRMITINILNTFIQIGIGSVVYIVLAYFFKNRIALHILDSLFSLIKKKGV